MRFSPEQLDRESSEPLYLQVFRILRAEITGTAAGTSAKMPSTTELARQFGVSQNTIRTAMRMLADSRLVCRIRHRGTIPVSCMLPEDPQLDNHSIGLVFPMEGHLFWQPILKLMHDAPVLKVIHWKFFFTNGISLRMKDVLWIRHSARVRALFSMGTGKAPTGNWWNNSIWNGLR